MPGSYSLIVGICVSTLLLCSCGNPELRPTGFAGEATERIQLNQVGYYPGQTITFTVTDPGISEQYLPGLSSEGASPELRLPKYYVTNIAGDSTLQEGKIGGPQDWTALAGVTGHPTEIDPLPAGDYRLYVPNVGYSVSFRVADTALRDAFTASVKGLYYQRASQALPEQHAGKWHRTAGHPDTTVLFHPSSGRKEGSLSSPGGWYDAGDYNKYIVNGAFPLGQLLSLYEDVGDPAPDGSLNIPESGNGKSDYLDEIKYELDWMLSMQDADGGLYHKLTTKSFEDMVMPNEATSQRYLVGKSTTATLDFAAATAQAARVYRGYDEEYADRLLTAARRAWVWAKAYPERYFENPGDIHTGQYGDKDANDERAWAAAELFATTGEQEYLNELQARPPRLRFAAGESWTGYMANMAAYSLLRYPDRVPQEMYQELQDLIVTLADSLVLDIEKTAYYQPIRTFEWGSNSDVLNAAMLIAAADLRESKPEYRAAMLRCTDYIFGHNPLGVSYLTGVGERSPMNIHHRQSAADGIEEPVPGLLSGGPNLKQQDREHADYPEGAAPMQSWVDQEGSYASNEICLNWNAPLTYVLGYLEARR